MITAIIQNYSNGVLVSTSEFKLRLLYGRDEKKKTTHPLPKKRVLERTHRKWGYHGVYSPPYGGGARERGCLFVVCCSTNFIQSSKLTTNYANDTNYIAISISVIREIRSSNHKVNYELRELHKLISNNDSCH